MRRKIFSVILGVLMMCGLCLVPKPAFAAGTCSGPFLGMKPWYDGWCENGEIKKVEGEDNLKSFIWRVVLNVVFDVTLVISYVAVAMVIYGGYLYIMSQGDPGKVAKGKKTLTSAVIGTVIALSASVIVNTAIGVLGINTSGGWNQGDFTVQQVKDIFNWVYMAGGIVAVAFIMKNGVDYMLSQGDPGKTKKALHGIIYAVAGLIVVFFAAVITEFVVKATQG